MISLFVTMRGVIRHNDQNSDGGPRVYRNSLAALKRFKTGQIGREAQSSCQMFAGSDALGLETMQFESRSAPPTSNPEKPRRPNVARTRYLHDGRGYVLLAERLLPEHRRNNHELRYIKDRSSPGKMPRNSRSLVTVPFTSLGQR